MPCSVVEWNPMKIDCAYKFRVYPTPEPEILLAKIFGSSGSRGTRSSRPGRRRGRSSALRPPSPDASALLTDLKNDPDFAFPGEVSSVPLQQALHHQ